MDNYYLFLKGAGGKIIQNSIKRSVVSLGAPSTRLELASFYHR